MLNGTAIEIIANKLLHLLYESRESSSEKKRYANRVIKQL